MIQINEDFRKLIPPLTPEEYQQLEKNLIEEGCRDPLVLWDQTIIDGHNRYEICTKNALPFKTVNKHFDSDAHVRVWMRNNQKGRRNLTHAWLIELELGNKEDLAKIGALKRAETVGRPSKEKLLSPSDNDLAKPKHNTQKQIAEKAGVSVGQVAMAEQVKKKAPDLWEKAKNGEIAIKTAYTEIKKEEKKAEHKANIEAQKAAIESGELKLPEGVFEVIAIDPPWNYGREYDPDGSRVANPYPEMKQEELLNISLPASNDSVLFLWTTHQFIWNAKELLDKWGFTYKATLVWDKERIGMGAWVRMQCEFCLVGIKGKPHWENTTWRDLIREPRREHSRKPDLFYEMVESVTLGRRLEYFSREKRNGWEVFGNDVAKF
jgi:N6-adenosine-specific RNA methylase IME4/anti-sigma28 factor (negative regulator of flagellin synthesis)